MPVPVLRAKAAACLVAPGASAGALWLLDEPTVGLDAAALAALSALIARHRAGGGSVVLSTHQGIALDAAATLSLADFPWRRPADEIGW
ncbi:MAG: hypothetical protein WDN69_34080 [Aliidongia sp.]